MSIHDIARDMVNRAHGEMTTSEAVKAADDNLRMLMCQLENEGEELRDICPLCNHSVHTYTVQDGSARIFLIHCSGQPFDRTKEWPPLCEGSLTEVKIGK